MDTAQLPVISGDSHVEESRVLWYDALSADLRDKAPKTIRQSQDGNWELAQHEQPLPGADGEKLPAEDAGRLAIASPEARLRATSEDGIAGECIYPTIGLYVWNVDDPATGRACCEIYNDWIYETLESQSPRFRSAGLIPSWDID